MNTSCQLHDEMMWILSTVVEQGGDRREPVPRKRTHCVLHTGERFVSNVFSINAISGRRHHAIQLLALRRRASQVMQRGELERCGPQ